MHLGNVIDGRREAGADRPDRLIGDHGIGSGHTLRQRAGQLVAHHVERPAGMALGVALAHADDRGQFRPPRGLGLGAHERIGLAMVGAALGMTQYHGGRPGIGDHLGRNLPGVRARPARMAVLRADADAGPQRDNGKGRQKRGRRRDEQVDLDPQRGIIARRDTAEFGNGGLQAIHLPVAGYQRSTP